MTWSLRPRSKQHSTDAAVDEELEFHFYKRIKALIAQGSAVEDARTQALAEFGDVEAVRAGLRAIDRRLGRKRRRAESLASLVRDVRSAIRSLFHQPLSSAGVVLILALGVGVNVALVMAFKVAFGPNPNLKGADTLLYFPRTASYPQFEYLRAHASTVDVIASSEEVLLMRGRGASEAPARISAEFVSGDYFAALQARAVIGRTFGNEDESAGKTQVAVLSHGFWQRRFGADDSVLGVTLSMANEKPFVVIGVTSDDFAGTGRHLPDVWLPIAARSGLPSVAEARSTAGDDWFRSREVEWLQLHARLRAGRGIDAARAEMRFLLGQDAGSGTAREPQDQRRAPTLETIAASGWLPLGRFPEISAGMMTATLLVFVIACVNIATLRLARAAARQREVGLRLCLGASRGRILQELVVESLVLSAAGGLLGTVFAWTTARGLLAAGALPATHDSALLLRALTPNGVIIAVAVSLSLFSVLIFGLGPALRASRLDLLTSIKAQLSPMGPRLSLNRSGSALIVVQVVLCVVLLVAATQLLRASIRAVTIDPGFNKQQVFTLYPSFKMAAYDSARRREFYRAFSERMHQLPDIHMANGWLPVVTRAGAIVTVSNEVSSDTTQASGHLNIVSSSFFKVLEIPIIRGRAFTDAEMRARAEVAVVSEMTAWKLWPDQDALGQRFAIEQARSDGFPRTSVVVIGVARDAHVVQVGEIPDVFVYLPGESDSGALLIRASGNRDVAAAQVRALVRSIDPNLMVATPTLWESIEDSNAFLQRARVAAVLTAALGALALLLSAVGLFGLMAYSVAQRTREIGVRIALGARRLDVIAMIIGRGLRLVSIGLAVGLAAGAACSRIMSSLLFGLGAFDVIAFGGVTLLLVSVALAACYLPARRASNVDPLLALRQE
jgi:predicted permease